MNYCYIINTFANDVCHQMQELYAFQEQYLLGWKEITTIVLARENFDFGTLQGKIGNIATWLQCEHYAPETVLSVLVEIAQQMPKETVFLFGSGSYGIELAVRLAVRLQGSSLTAVHALEWTDAIYAKKMVYSNHMEGTFRLNQAPYCIALAKGLDKKVLIDESFHFDKIISCKQPSHIFKRSEQVIQSSNDLADAKFIIAAGRGVKKKEHIVLLQEIAELFGGKLGISRPLAMQAMAPMQCLLGVSGTMVQPEICITVGISGAAAFYAGIEKSKCIIAINTDEHAPIFKKADVLVHADFIAIMQTIYMLAKKEKMENETTDFSNGGTI